MYIINILVKKSNEKEQEKMRKLSEVIVKNRYIVLAVIFVLTIFSAVMIPNRCRHGNCTGKRGTNQYALHFYCTARADFNF